MIKGKRLMPTYLVEFLEEVYPFTRPANFGCRMVSRQFIAETKALYEFVNKEPISNYSRRLVPEYLIKFLEDVDYVEFEYESTDYTYEIGETVLKFAEINYIGGMSYKYNQLANITSGSGADESSSNVLYLTLTNVSNSSVVGHKYLFAINVLVSDNTKLTKIRVRQPFVSSETSLLSSKSRYYFIGTATEINEPLMQLVKASSSATNETYSYDTVNVIDLTSIFGSGNEPNNLENAKPLLKAMGIDIDQYNEYNLGTIRDSAVTSVVSKDADGNTIDTYNIPAEIQALEGYGWGINDTCYNYIDFKNKKFNKIVGRVDLGSLDYERNYSSTSEMYYFVAQLDDKALGKYNLLCSIYGLNDNGAGYSHLENMNIVGSSSLQNNHNYIYIRNDTYTTAEDFKTAMSGVYLYYELATPVETNISIDDSFIQVASGGSVTFTNTHEQYVPTSVTYLVEV